MAAPELVVESSTREAHCRRVTGVAAGDFLSAADAPSFYSAAVIAELCECALNGLAAHRATLVSFALYGGLLFHVFFSFLLRSQCTEAGRLR